jgi:V/A-type H+-transporting ATPase subunit I
MITPMRHVTLLCRADDSDTLLESLRDAGVVHLNLTRKLNHDLERHEEDLKNAEKIIQKLEGLPPSDTEPEDESPAEIIREILCRDQELRDITGVETKLQRELKQWEPFGTIDTATLTALRAGGLHIAFYRAPGNAPVCPPEVTWIPAREGFGLALSTEPLPELTAEKLTLPVRGPHSLRSRLDRLADMTRRHKLAIARHTASLDALRAHRDELTDLCAYERANLGMDSEGEIRWITGFTPVSQMDAVQSVAEQAGAALFGRAPEETDATPTHLEQNSVVSWIQPVFSFLGVTPGYKEVDVGWSFLLFLTLFSGMIIGDAGYGVVLLLLVGGLNLLKPGTRGQFANLLYCMGGATVIWGLLTGNVFGIESLPAALERFKVPALADPNDPMPLMRVCFLLGAGHLTLAHAWNLWRKRTSLAALADLGWIGSTWTMYFVTGMMVLGEDLPAWIAPLFIVSVVLILLFMTPPAKLKEEWVQHMMLPLSFVNNFVDVVSYVRLYAVGMATFALASSFNTMIFGEGTERGILATGIMMIILLLGHALNFILAGMGIMVHGIRLNTLEFASHMGLTWSGIPYKPFTRISKTDN